MKRSLSVAAAGAAAAGLLGYFIWTTLASQRFECEVCVEFHGKRNCATASAVSESAAARAAQATACGTLARGRIESTNCARATPLSRRCRRLGPSASE
jgi:hypothetical protein